MLMCLVAAGLKECNIFVPELKTQHIVINC